MKPSRLLLGVAWVPVLSGCMLMGGIGHAGGFGGIPAASREPSGRTPEPLHRAEASNGGLTIVLSFPAPSGGAAVAIDAWLIADSTHLAPTDGDVRLRIQTPGGRVDHIRMQRRDSWSTTTYQAYYRFANGGLYLVTAEGRTGTGADLRTVSVTVEVAAGGAAQVGDQHWIMPAALVGSLGMVATMVLMTGGF